jgi:NADPH-dependent 7-cyano-7-deazaguanine reductase QueF-like protein
MLCHNYYTQISFQKLRNSLIEETSNLINSKAIKSFYKNRYNNHRQEKANGIKSGMHRVN